jgi:hypothetical protein
MVSKPLTISEEIPEVDAAPVLNDEISPAPIPEPVVSMVPIVPMEPIEVKEPEKAVEVIQPEPPVFIANLTPPTLDDSVKPEPFEEPEQPVEQKRLESQKVEPEPIEVIPPIVPSAFIASPAPAIEIPSTPLPIEELKEPELKQPEQKEPEQKEPEPSVVNVAPTPAPPIVTPEEVIATPMLMTRQDVIAAYKLFLNRLPESFEVMQTRVNSSAEANLIDFSLSDEFIKRSDLPAIIFPIAKKVVEAQAKEQSPSQTPTQS